ncbi:HAD family phosphatase [Streptosporangium fragile]|uniref:HAD family phosphatase n=1 Tax=Streptosporangium fragile TaxID=46186 RepID=A0ABN3W173_9ACTN
MKWVVVDYAGVVSLAPPERAGALLPRTLGVAPHEFWAAYRRERRAYDLGEVEASRFWGAVGERVGVTVDPDLLEVLVTLDLRAWTHLDEETLAVLREVAGSGVALALLADAPVELARLIDGRPWARLFRHRFFSADLRRAGPDPQVFRQACERLGAHPDDLLFVGGRRENVLAARALGIEAVLFGDASRLRSDLAGAGVGVVAAGGHAALPARTSPARRRTSPARRETREAVPRR